MLRGLAGRLLLVSVLPLAVIASANFVLFLSLNRSIVLEQHATLLRHHRGAVEAFLDALTSQVSALANGYTRAELEAGELSRAFELIRQRQGVLTDVGIIDASGRHRVYIGPYDLAGRDYHDAEWFRRVSEDGVYISDVYLGFRGVPHFVIAIRRDEGPSFWVLRATVSTDYFARLVASGRIGRTGEVFIVDAHGLYQTPGIGGTEALNPSGLPWLEPHDDIQVHRRTEGGHRVIYATAWLSRPTWLLVSRQEVWDAYTPLREAIVVGIGMSSLGIAAAAVLAFAVARSHVRRIRRADHERQVATERLVAAGQTAAVGEMSAGLAHEINNPLATIEVLGTLVSDLAAGRIGESERLDILEAAAGISRQTARCKAITQGLLKLARRVESKPEKVNVNEVLAELGVIAQARARVEGVELTLSLGEAPPVYASATLVQQIVVNLVNNAIDAVAGRPGGRVDIASRATDGCATITVRDNGPGIRAEDTARIFRPYFTTKPAGKGTGLGLAICHNLVTALGGRVSVRSEPGEGATFEVLLPAAEDGT